MKKEKCFFLFSCYDQYAMIKREKTFFHLATMFTNEEKNIYFFHIATTISRQWSREKKLFFLLATIINTPLSREKSVFCHIATTITTPLSREEKVFFISRLCSEMKKEKYFFSFIHYDHYAMTKRESFFFI